MTSISGTAVFLALAAVAAAGCGDGALVTLGDGHPPAYRFGTPRMLSELDDGHGNENPTLTGDLLEIYFNSNHGDTESDIWRARRAAVGDRFGAAELVAELSLEGYDVNPGVSLDGLAIWFGSERAGGEGNFDVWSATRATRDAAWSAPANLAALSSPRKDIPRSPGQHGLVLPIASQRDVAEIYQLYFAARSSVSDPFGTPVLVAELSLAAGLSIGDAFLSDDGLTLFYASAPPGGKSDLYVAWRSSTSRPFTLTEPLRDLDTAAEERDPWLSPDGTRFYFVSDRDGIFQIYEAPVTRAPGHP